MIDVLKSHVLRGSPWHFASGIKSYTMMHGMVNAHCFKVRLLGYCFYESGVSELTGVGLVHTSVEDFLGRSITM